MSALLPDDRAVAEVFAQAAETAEGRRALVRLAQACLSAISQDDNLGPIDAAVLQLDEWLEHDVPIVIEVGS